MVQNDIAAPEIFQLEYGPNNSYVKDNYNNYSIISKTTNMSNFAFLREASLVRHGWTTESGKKTDEHHRVVGLFPCLSPSWKELMLMF